jgi:hypothetical protein
MEVMQFHLRQPIVTACEFKQFFIACAHKELPIFKPDCPIYRGTYKNGVYCEIFTNSHGLRSFLLLTCRRMPTTSDRTPT